jgi:hypothetical protein
MHAYAYAAAIATLLLAFRFSFRQLYYQAAMPLSRFADFHCHLR